jgi:hypothetical protein
MSEAAKHTPGPWKFRPNWRRTSGVVDAASGRRIATIHVGESATTEQIIADGHLVAAAPKMLAALEQVEPMARTLMDELGRGPATNWGIVNKCLCDVAEAIRDAKAKPEARPVQGGEGR